MKEKIKSNKSGELELLRFISCLIVIGFHFNKHILGHVAFPGSKWGFFVQGVVGVEFFFVCSGFLMAASAAKEYRIDPLPNDKALGKSTSSFMFRKIMTFLPYHIIAYILAWGTVTFIHWKGIGNAVKSIIDCVPSFFLVHMSGWKMGNPQFVEWYLSVMVLGMLILFPIIRKHYHVFTRVIAPAVGIFLLGYLFHKYHRLGGVKDWDVLTFTAMLRGIAELCLGAFTYEIVQILKEKINIEKAKLINTLIFVFGTIGFVLFTWYDSNNKLQFIGVPICMVLVGVCFMGGTCLSGALNNRFIMFLGKFSLPLYLAQVVGVRIAESKLLPKTMGQWPRIAVGVAITVVTAVIVLLIGNLLMKLFKRKKDITQPEAAR